MNRRPAIVKTARNLLSVCVFLLCASSVALAQAGRGSISGLISDPSGAIVKGAQVTALDQATGVALHTVTSEAGLYSFVSLTLAATSLRPVKRVSRASLKKRCW